MKKCLITLAIFYYILGIVTIISAFYTYSLFGIFGIFIIIVAIYMTYDIYKNINVEDNLMFLLKKGVRFNVIH